MTNFEFVDHLLQLLDSKTMYIYGGIGGALHERNKARALKRIENQKRKVKIDAATPDTFGCDCVGMIKTILWGWCGDQTLNYGGATYKANDVPDIGADTMIDRCVGVTRDFSKIEVGEMVWMSGHCGVYIGDGQIIESTPIWDDGVQITRCQNLQPKLSGAKVRLWSQHGRLPWVEYLPQQLHRGDAVRIMPDLYSDADGITAQIVELNAENGEIKLKVF